MGPTGLLEWVLRREGAGTYVLEQWGSPLLEAGGRNGRGAGWPGLVG